MPNYISVWENVNTKKRVNILSTRYMKTGDITEGFKYEKLVRAYHVLKKVKQTIKIASETF